MSDLTIGSHLITPRIGYTHHGIYIGHQQVIHFTRNSHIEIVSLSDFTDGQGYDTQSFHSKFSRKEIVDRALSRVGNDHYNVIFNNCEHFCNWCIHDEHRSQQVRNVTLGSAVSGITAQSILKQAPTVAGLTLAEMTAASSMTTGFTLLSTTPIIPAALVGFGVFKLVQFLNDQAAVMDNEFWLDIWGGDSSYDIYEDNQSFMNELYPPDPERNTVQFNLLQYEDIPF